MFSLCGCWAGIPHPSWIAPAPSPAHLFLAEVLKLDSCVEVTWCSGLAWPRANGEFSAVLKDPDFVFLPQLELCNSRCGSDASGEQTWGRLDCKGSCAGRNRKPELCTSNGPWMQNRMEEALARGRGWVSPACPRQPCRSTTETQGWQSHPATLHVPSSLSPHHQKGRLKI